MMGIKHRHLKTHSQINLDDLVPPDNFYRELDAKLDLTFVRDLVAHLYAPFGRPSVDPVVFFKLQLIMFFEAIRSERSLMQTVPMRLDQRWYLGYDLDEELPDHSSLTRIRERYGVAIFQQFFEQIVEHCIEAGLVWGEELFFDGSLVLANASAKARIPRFYWDALQQHVDTLFGESNGDMESQPNSAIPPIIERYAEPVDTITNGTYKRQADYWVNPNDPNATPAGTNKLGYRLHYAVDGGRSRIIVNCLVTPSAVQDQTPMLDLAWQSRFRYDLDVKRMIADAKYGTGENLQAIEQQGIQALMPVLSQTNINKHNKDFFPASVFTYVPKEDLYLCPNDKPLFLAQTHEHYDIYQASKRDCDPCPLRTQCTSNKRGRTITRSVFQEYRDRVAAYQKTALYQKSMRKRQVWVEPKFGEYKQWHLGRRLRLRGISKVNIEALMKAAGQNIKQLLKARKSPFRPLPPPATAALREVRGQYPGY